MLNMRAPRGSIEGGSAYGVTSAVGLGLRRVKTLRQPLYTPKIKQVLP